MDLQLDKNASLATPKSYFSFKPKSKPYGHNSEHTFPGAQMSQQKIPNNILGLFSLRLANVQIFLTQNKSNLHNKLNFLAYPSQGYFTLSTIDHTAREQTSSRLTRVAIQT